MIPKGIIEMPRPLRFSPPAYTGPSERNSIGFQSFQIICQYKRISNDAEDMRCIRPQSNFSLSETVGCACQEMRQRGLERRTRDGGDLSPGLSIEDENNASLSNQKFKSANCRRVFRKLSLVLEKLFLGREVRAEDLRLSEPELKVLREVTAKKLVATNAEGLALLEHKAGHELMDELNRLISEHKSVKRVEENNKFIYKYTMKYLKKQFFADFSLKNSKESEIQFYEHYFRPLSVELKTQIDDFYDPLYKTLNKNPTYKTINNKYLSLIFSSNQFKNDFFGFLKQDFKKTYCDTIPHRLTKFFKKLKTDVDDSAPKTSKKNSAVGKFAEKLKKSRKCKLPWTYKEVCAALVQFSSLIYYY